MLKLIKNEAITVSPDELSFILNDHTSHIFSQEYCLFTSGQVPIFCFVLVSGEILITRKNMGTYTLKSPCVLGVKQLLDDVPSKFNAVIKQNSRVCMIDKFQLKQIITDDDHLLTQIISRVV